MGKKNKNKNKSQNTPKNDVKKPKRFPIIPVAVALGVALVIGVVVYQNNMSSAVADSDITAENIEKSYADYVDPMLGTSSSRWMLYPGPSMPFGMVKLSPDNTDGEGLNAGYEYTVESLSGFGHVH